MNIITGINRFTALLFDSLKQFASLRAWLLMIAYFLLNWVVLYILNHFSSSFFYGVVDFWVSLFNPQARIGFTHYPGHFLLLPYFAGLTKFWLGLVVEGAVLGAVSVIVYRRILGDEREKEGWRRPQLVFLWLNLSLAWLVLNGLSMLAGQFLPDLLRGMTARSPRMTFAMDFGVLPGLFIIIWALFFTAIPVVAAHRENIIRALGRSLKIFVKNPLSSLVLAALAILAPVLLNTAASRSDFIVENFKPEMVYWLLVTAYGSEILAGIFWMSSSVNLLIRDEENL